VYRSTRVERRSLVIPTTIEYHFFFMKTRPLKTCMGNLALAFGALLLALLMLEIVCRAATYWQNRETTYESFVASHPPPTGEIHLKDILRPSRKADVIFELIPDITSATFLGAKLTTNSHGFRGRSYALKKDAETTRIVGLGDSVMFGWGVPDGADYLSVLETMIRKWSPDARWEVVNTAVPGYNTPLEVATLEEKALRFAPDLVIVGYCENDLELPRFVRKFASYHESYLGLTKSYLWYFVLERLARIEVDEDTPRFLRRMRRLSRTPATDRTMIPPEYAHLSGFEAFQKSMRRLRTLSRLHDFDVVVLFHPLAPDNIAAIARANGFRIVDTRFAIERFLIGRGIEDLVGSPLTLSENDYHPSILGHKLIAEVLFEGLKEQGFLAKAP
jgi:lysophospholipase L1-like esterase